MSDLLTLSLSELSGEILAGRVSPVEATEACLRAIEERDGELNSFLTVCADSALATARSLQEELAMGRYRGPLHGAPIALKDLYLTAGIRTTVGTLIHRDWVPDQDATVVRHLREAGTVMLGKLNMHEFAFGPTGENPHYGTARNPHDTSRICGGSSSGSASAVAAGLCYGSLGSDTGGSIRLPAALCGIVGLKPTYGRVSRTGVVPLSWSLDHVGPMTRTVRDAALLQEAISGYDPADPTSSQRPIPSYTREMEGPVKGLRIGIPREHFWSPLHPEVGARVREAIEMLRDAGVEAREVSLPSLELAPAVQSLIIHSEAAAYHQRTLRERSGEYGRTVRVRLLQGLGVSAADYLNAQRARQQIRRELLACLQEVDALVTPGSPIPAPTVGQAEVTFDGVTGPPAAYLVRNTFPFNLTGLPAVSVPCGWAEGLPAALQIAGRPWEEGTVLRLARVVEEGVGVER